MCCGGTSSRRVWLTYIIRSIRVAPYIIYYEFYAGAWKSFEDHSTAYLISKISGYLLHLILEIRYVVLNVFRFVLGS